MLKIKDNVDLKELKKFGFEEYTKEYQLFCGGEILCIYKDDRKMYIETQNMWDIAEDSFGVIYDLIKADLVEKLENDGKGN